MSFFKGGPCWAAFFLFELNVFMMYKIYMNPITHFLAGWTVANIAELDKRERVAVTVAGVIPDIDGFGLVAEKLTDNSTHPLTWWSDYHHVLAHNIFFGILVAVACYSVATRKRAVAALAFLSFHVHLLGDVVGAGGPDGEHWPIPYLWPVTERIQLVWQGQWAINAWQNVVITGILLMTAFVLSWRRGFSPLEMVSVPADRVFVKTLRNRFPFPPI